MAARDGPVENIRALVKEGMDVAQDDAVGQTALHYATYYGNIETVRVILELGGNAHARSVAMERHMEPPWVLEKVWGDLCTEGAYGLTPLDIAAAADGYTEAVRLLVNRMGGDALAQDADGNLTPLHHAADAGHSETVKLLLELGANVNA
jgi:ankyrin repeat protein